MMNYSCFSERMLYHKIAFILSVRFLMFYTYTLILKDKNIYKKKLCKVNIPNTFILFFLNF